MFKKQQVKTNGTANKAAIKLDRKKRMTLSITQRGIHNHADLSDFYSAAISDIDGGRADLDEMAHMTELTRQIVTLETLRLKVASRLKKANPKFFLQG